MKKSQNKSNENKKFTGKKPAKSNFSKSTERPKVQIFIKKFDTFEDAWKELNKIPSAPATLLPAFCENDGYWMKLFFISGNSEIVFSKQSLDEMIKEANKWYYKDC